MDATGSEVISTKVSVWAGEALRRAANRLGTNRYSLLQTFIDCLLRFIDDWGEATQDLHNLMQMMVGSFHYILQTSGISRVKDKPMDLHSAIMFLHEKGKDPKHQSCVWVKNNFMGQTESNYNVQHMFDHFMQMALPAQYHHLQEVARRNDMSSLVEALNYLCLREDGESEVAASVKALFSDNERLQYGKNVLEYDKKYKGHKHYSVDTAHVNREGYGQRQNVSQANLFSDMEEDS